MEYRNKYYKIGGKKDSFFINKFSTEIEYVSPEKESFCMGEFISEKHMGIHHIRFSINSQKDAVEYMESHGIKILECGDSVQRKGVKYTIFDSYEKLGFYIETLNLAEFE